MSLFRRRASYADHLPWAARVQPGVFITTSGALLATFQIRSPDMDSMMDAVIEVRQAQLNHLIMRYGYGWALHIEAQRRPATRYPVSEWSHPVARLIDAERRALFADAGLHFETDVYVSLVMQTPQDRKARGMHWVYERATDERSTPYQEIIASFADEVTTLEGLLKGMCVEVTRLDDDALMAYLHTCCSTKRHPVELPRPPVFLSHAMADEVLVGGEEPILGTAHLRVLSIKSWPRALWPGILGLLDDLPFAMRIVIRWLALDKDQAHRLTHKAQRRWLQKRKPMLTMLRDELTKQPSAMFNPEAVHWAQDAVEAQADLETGLVSYGYLTFHVVLWDEEFAQLDEHIKLVERTINGEGFTTLLETHHSIEAFFATMPGNLYEHINAPPTSSENLVDSASTSAPWAGPLWNDHLNGPVLCYATTNTATPFRVCLHDGDVGNFVMIGPVGSGKDTLLWFLAAQFLRYPGAQVFAIDKGHGSKCMTAVMGGTYESFDHGSTPGQPLAGVDDEFERLWAHGWLIEIVEAAGVTVTPAYHTALFEALRTMGDLPRQERTLTNYRVLVQEPTLREVLGSYTSDGPYGMFFDGDEDLHRMEWWHVLAMDRVVETPAVLPSLLGYRFHCMERYLHEDKPTLVLINEFGEFLNYPSMLAHIDKFLIRFRKLNASVGLAAQRINQVGAALIAAAGNEIPTRIMLANPRCLEEGISTYYTDWGFNEREQHLIAEMTPKRHYYFQNRHGRRQIEFGFGPITLAYTASGSATDLAQIDTMMGEAPTTFAADWLRYKKVPLAATVADALMENLVPQEDAPWTPDEHSYVSALG